MNRDPLLSGFLEELGRSWSKREREKKLFGVSSSVRAKQNQRRDERDPVRLVNTCQRWCAHWRFDDFFLLWSPHLSSMADWSLSVVVYTVCQKIVYIRTKKEKEEVGLTSSDPAVGACNIMHKTFGWLVLATSHTFAADGVYITKRIWNQFQTWTTERINISVRFSSMCWCLWWRMYMQYTLFISAQHDAVLVRRYLRINRVRFVDSIHSRARLTRASTADCCWPFRFCFVLFFCAKIISQHQSN